jgi:DNA ligase-1
MLPNNVLLQESMTAIKKFRSDLSPHLLYHVYDIVDNTLSYEERLSVLQQMFDESHIVPPNVRFVMTAEVKNEAEVFRNHKIFVSHGYEGTMIRNPTMTYEIGKRSYSLLKLKDFVDAEFRIVNVIDGDGSDSGLAIFELETSTGQKFNCRPEGTQENRAELFKNRKKLIGKYLTVRYQELSKDGVPIFPVGVSIREWGEF